MNKSDVDGWKKAQASEFDFYNDYLEKEGTSQHFNIAYKFGIWGFNDFENRSVLEVGSGIFGPIHSIEDRGTFKVGIDPLLGRLYKRVPSRGIFHVRSVGEALPFSTEKFDVVICYNVLDHVVNPERVLEEIHRVLKKSGTFLLCINTHIQIMQMITPTLEQLDVRHPYHFTSKDIKPLLERHVFKIARIKILRAIDDVPNAKYRFWLIRKILRNAKWRPFLALFFVRIVYANAKKIP